MLHPSDKSWWLAHSGDYVLGLLSDPDRLVFERIMQSEPEIKQLVLDWRELLLPMSSALTPIEPPEHILASLISHLPIVPGRSEDDDTYEPVHLTNRQLSIIDENGEVSIVPGTATVTGASTNAMRAADEQASKLADGTAFMRMLNKKQSSLDGWRSFAGLALVACLFMGVYGWTGFQKYQLSQNTSSANGSGSGIMAFDGISIVEDPSAQPLWIVDSSSNDKTLRVTAIAPPEIDEDKTFELWMVTTDDSLVSMGTIPVDINASNQFNAAQFDAQAPSFGVSLEPTGGSPDDLPTGPLLYRGLIKSLSY